MESPSSTASVAPGASFKLAAQTTGLIIGVTAIVFGSVLALGVTVPLVRSHIAVALAIAIPVHALFVLAVERWISGGIDCRGRGSDSHALRAGSCTFYGRSPPC